MCGRFTQTKSRKEELEALGKIELPPLFQSRYNIAPTQKIAVIHQQIPSRIEACIWGFKNSRSGAPIINARSETLTERPLFKNLLTNHRCLILADGFYEWKSQQPYYFQLPQKQLFAFAGLWHDNRCVILTRTADSNMHGIHTRMPVILTSSHWRHWLETFSPLKQPPTLVKHPVSRRVNKVIHDDPVCIHLADEQIHLSLFPNRE